MQERNLAEHEEEKYIPGIAHLHCFFIHGLSALLRGSSIFVRIFKWELLLKGQGFEVPFGKLAGMFFVGNFFKSFLPGTIGADIVRIYDVSKMSSKILRPASTVIVDRISGFSTLLVMGFTASIFGCYTLPNPRLILLTGSLLLIIISIIVVFLHEPFIRRVIDRSRRLLRPILHEKILDLIDKTYEVFMTYKTKRGLILHVLMLSVVAQFVSILVCFIVSLAIEADISILHFLIFVPIVTVLGSIPLSINGLGIREGGYVFFLGLVGVPPTSSLSLALLIRFINTINSLLGGLVYLFRSSST